MQQKATDKKKKAMIKAMEKCLGVVSTACKVVGIDRATHYRWMKSDSEYKEIIDDVENLVIDFAESQLHKQIEDGNTAATIFYLKTKGKPRGYVERQEIAHDGSIESTLIQWKPAEKE